MTQEEKAKAYDEAIERARYWEKNPTIWSSDDICQKLFPELKESEDENIRKELLSFIQNRADNFPNDPKYRNIDKWIAWLEKQGEHTNFRNKVQIGDQVTRNRDGVLVNLSQLNRVAKKDEKQGEQKPNYCHHEVDLSGCSEEYRKAYYDGWNNCNMQHSQCKSELDDVVKCLINGMKFYYEDNEEATWGTDKWSMPVKHIIEVLEKYGSQNLTNSCKTCKDEQKPTEWSEEDVKMIENIIDTINMSIEDCDVDDIGTKARFSLEKERDWLKSIRPQNTWKPSDEQMHYLSWIANVKLGNSVVEQEVSKHLNELLEDLKKLTE